MNTITLNLLSIALWGTVVAIIVLAVRPFVKKNSNRFMCILWAMVMFRFLCPFAIKAPVLNYYSDNTVENNIVENSSVENSGAENNTATMNMADMKNSIEDKFAMKKKSTIEDLSEVKELSAIEGLAEIKPQSLLEGQSTMNAQSSMDDQIATRAQSSMDDRSATKASSVMEEWTNTQRTSDAENAASVRDTMNAEDVTGTQDATNTQNMTDAQDISDTIGTKQRATKGSVFNFITEHKQAWSNWIQSTAGHRLLSIFGAIWLLGTIIILACGTVKYLFIKRKLNEAIRIGRFDKYLVRTSDISGVPMAFGIFKPGIYVPVSFRKSGNVKSNPLMERQKELILWHEAMHLKHRDPIWLVISFLMFALHWWNPLVWISTRCIHKDIEMACDEAVLKQIGQEAKGEYAKTLYDFATERDTFTVFAAFGETDAESRIKNTLRYKKASVWVTAVTLFFVLGLCGCLALKPTAALDVEQAELEDEKTSLDGNQDDLESQKTDSLNGPLDELSAENGDAKEPTGPLWVFGDEEYITSYPMEDGEAQLCIKASGDTVYFNLAKDGEVIGNGAIRPGKEVSVYEWRDYKLLSIDEIGFADTNLDHMNDLIVIGRSENGKGAFIVESENGSMRLKNAEDSEEMRTFSVNVTNSIPENELSVESVKNLIFGKEYDGTFKTWQEAYRIMTSIEGLHYDYTNFDLIYFDDDDIPELIVGVISPVKMYQYEDGQIYCSELQDVSSYELYCIERQGLLVSDATGYSDQDSPGYIFYGMDKDHMIHQKDGNIDDYDKSDLKRVLENGATYKEMLYRLGATDVHAAIGSRVTMVETSYESDSREYTEEYLKLIDQMEEEYQGETIKYDLIYLNNDRIPDLVVGLPGQWISIYLYEGGQMYTVWDKKVCDNDFTCLYREGVIYSHYTIGQKFKDFQYLYFLKPDHTFDILSVTYEGNWGEDAADPEIDYFNDLCYNWNLGDKGDWYYNGNKISKEEVYDICDCCPYSTETKISGKASAGEIRIQLLAKQDEINKRSVVAKDSLYEKFKNNNEKIYFDRYIDDGRNGPNLDLAKGYTLSELLDVMLLHYSRSYEYDRTNVMDLKADFAYIDCGQDGISEMALEIQGIGISSLHDGSAIVYVIKELDGKLQCTYGYETGYRSLTTLNEAGILAQLEIAGACSTSYDISIFDKDANIHRIYSAYEEEKWDIKDDFCTYRYDAQMGEDSYACYVTDDPDYSNEKILMDVIRENNLDSGYRFEDNMRYPKEFAELREKTLEKYGCTNELIEAETVFGGNASWLETPKDVIHRALGEGLNWN